ncbi:MAG: hypothetical protein RSG96_03480 [Clostridia bacterium]
MKSTKTSKVNARILWVLLVIVLAAAAALLIWHFAGASGISVKNGHLVGVQSNWLAANLGTDASPKYRKVAEVTAPSGYFPMENQLPMGVEPELYYAPADASSPVRFLCYTTGAGSYRTLSDTAVKAYQGFYDDFASPGAFVDEAAGQAGFDYTCSYQNQQKTARVYEQTAVRYYRVTDNVCVVCIVSLTFDSPEKYLNDLTAYTDVAGAALALEAL